VHLDGSAAARRRHNRDADAVPRCQVRDGEKAHMPIHRRIRERWMGQLLIELP